MGQRFSHPKPARERPYQHGSTLMAQPTDILDDIFEIADPDTRIAFALSCKGLYDRFFAAALASLQSAEREYKLAVQLLWEKDIGHKQYYCPACRDFRSFDTNWRAGRVAQPQDLIRSGFHRSRRQPRQPCPSTFDLGFDPLCLTGYSLNFNIARLVMNRHLLGRPRGLPLSCLEADLIINGPNFPLVWDQTWRAKIIEDELYLCVTHVLSQTAQDMSGKVMRGHLKQQHYGLCKHVDTRLGSYCSVLPLEEISEDVHTEKDMFVPCQDVLGACEFCLTDFRTSIQWCEEERVIRSGPRKGKIQTREGWKITITVYHQMGQCRSMYDWKWLAATGNGHTWVSITRRGIAREYAQGLANSPFGAVQKRWEQGSGTTRETKQVIPRVSERRKEGGLETGYSFIPLLCPRRIAEGI